MLRRKQSYYWRLLAVALGMFACQNRVKHPSGFEYVIYKHGDQKAGGMDYCKRFRYALLRSNGDTINSSNSLVIDYLVSKPKDVEASMLSLLSEEDSAHFYIEARSLGGLADEIPKNEELVYVISVTNTETFAEYNMRKTIIEEKVIKDYINPLVVKEKKVHEPSGMNYLVHVKGEGKPANEGDSVVVYFYGSFLDDKYFVMQKEKPLGIRVIGNTMIPAWRIAFTEILTKGSEISILVPSRLGYGDQGDGSNIPPFTPVRFQFKVLDIIRKGER